MIWAHWLPIGYTLGGDDEIDVCSCVTRFYRTPLRVIVCVCLVLKIRLKSPVQPNHSPNYLATAVTANSGLMHRKQTIQILRSRVVLALGHRF